MYQVMLSSPTLPAPRHDFLNTFSSITVGPLTLTKPEVTLKDWFGRAFRGSDTEPDHIRTEEPEAVDMEVINLQPHVAPIYKITGTPTSYRNTLTNLTDRKDEKWANVRTAEDEGCSWVLLLDALQTQLSTSRVIEFLFQ